MKSAIEIVKLLRIYKDRVTNVLGMEVKTISNAYSFITADLVGTGNNTATIEFEITATSGQLSRIYPEIEELKMRITSAGWPGLDSVTDDDLPEHVVKSLMKADSIANLVLNCASGDDYWPGNFSEVIYGSKYIELRQVNYMNAKSLDHRKDYSLRSLVFHVPMSADTKMTWEFTDRSSENNRRCGDSIKAALDWLPD